MKGRLEIVRTLLEHGADLGAKDEVRNQNGDDDDDYNDSTNYHDDDCY
jgi:hypothetical protein